MVTVRCRHTYTELLQDIDQATYQKSSRWKGHLRGDLKDQNDSPYLFEFSQAEHPLLQTTSCLLESLPVQWTGGEQPKNLYVYVQNPWAQTIGLQAWGEGRLKGAHGRRGRRTYGILPTMKVLFLSAKEKGKKEGKVSTRSEEGNHVRSNVELRRNMGSWGNRRGWEWPG